MQQDISLTNLEMVQMKTKQELEGLVVIIKKGLNARLNQNPAKPFFVLLPEEFSPESLFF